ncbi:hypothetical protein [Zhihengliuella alba]
MIITSWGDDFAHSVSSPQLPGIVAAFDDLPSPAEVHSLAVEAGLDPDGSIDGHMEFALEIEGDTFLLRARHDARFDDRRDVAHRIERALHTDAGIREYAETDSLGDKVVVAALPNDRLRDVMATVLVDQPVTIGCVTNPGTLEFIGISMASTVEYRRTLADMDLTSSSTVGELMLRANGAEPSDVVQHERVLVGA